MIATDEHLRRLERLYHGAPTNRLTPAKLRLEPGLAYLKLPLLPDYHQAVGGVHGMLYFKAADEAAFYAAQTLVEDVFLTTATVTLHLLAPLQEGTMHAHAKVVHRTRSSFLVDVLVTDDAGDTVGRSSLTLVRGKQPLPD